MQEWGITPNDTVSLCALNHINTCVPVFASLFIGAKLVCFDQMMNMVEAKLLLQQVDPKIMFVDKGALEFVEKMLTENEFLPEEVDESEIALIFFSSGTTDMPKAIYLSHRAFLGQMQVHHNLNLPYDRLVNFSTFYWTVTLCLWGVLIIKGYCNILINNIDNMGVVWRAFLKHKPTYLITTPFFIKVLWHSKPASVTVDYIKSITIVGSIMTEHEMVELRKDFPKTNIQLGYGSTETGLLLHTHTTTKKDLEFYNKKITTIGSVLNGISYKIVDIDTDEVLGPYQKGELRVKTKSLLSGYYNNNRNNFIDVDEWYKTGDVMYYDNDYYFYYVERLKRMIKYQSFHVSPKMIENELMLRDDIRNVCVIGIPHKLDEEHPMAIIELEKRSLTKNNLEKEIFQYIEEKLGDKFKLVGANPIDKHGILTTPECVGFETESKGIGHFLYKYYQQHETKIMQIDGFTDEKDTYASVLERIIGVALKMQEWGVTPNDTISLCCLNHINTCVPVFASLFIGAKLVCFDLMMNMVEAKLLLKQVDPKIMFVDKESLEFVEKILADSNKSIKIVVFGECSKYDNFFDLLTPHLKENEFLPKEVDQSEIAPIFFSSGTTVFSFLIFLAEPTYNNGILTTPKCDGFKTGSKGIGHFLYKYFQKHGTKTMQIDGYTDEKDTYASVLQRIIRIALKMQEWGITAEDTVSLCAMNHINACVPVFASLFIGAKLVCFDQIMNMVESKLLLEQVDPKIMFVDKGALEFVEKMLTDSNKSIKIVVFGECSKYDNFFELLSPHPEENEFLPKEVDESKIALIFFSSGTTDMPKAIYLSHRAFLGQIQVQHNLNLPYDRLATFSTFYWTITLCLWGVLIIKGYCNILIHDLENMNALWKSFSKHKPTYIISTPFVIKKVWRSKPVSTTVDYIESITIVGSIMTEHEMVELRKDFPKTKIQLGYGSTETGLLLHTHTTTKKDLEFYNKKITTIGSVLNGISYKIVDIDTDEVLGPYQKGELRVKSNNLLSGYYNSNRNDIFDFDGWYKTGDIMYYDKDYYFYYVERLKRMIKFRSFHVSPIMIENELMLRDDISNVCVIGVPHEVDEEHPMAIIELKEIYLTKKNLEKEIFQYIEDKLGDKFKLLGGIKFVDKIPITPSGKYNVRKLKSMFVENSN
ncbi:hypothetical protein FQR65_LT01963 [Abscondita terminalis]|nr:hypothetical protein FQR65_LT01963 [Abscondita terminalis]